MKKNLGFTDRLIRFLVAVVLVVYAVNNDVSTVWIGIISVISGVLVFNALSGYCLMYKLLHLDTSKNRLK